MKTKYMLSECVKFNAPTFTFDFNNNGEEDIISLSGSLKSSEVYGNTYFFQYEFNDNVPSSTRSAFIHALKFDQSQLGASNVDNFIETAISNLSTVIISIDKKLS